MRWLLIDPRDSDQSSIYCDLLLMSMYQQIICNMFIFQRFLHLQFFIGVWTWFRCNRWAVKWVIQVASLLFIHVYYRDVAGVLTRWGDNVTIVDDSAAAAYSSQVEMPQDGKLSASAWLQQGLNLTIATSVGSDYQLPVCLGMGGYSNRSST